MNKAHRGIATAISLALFGSLIGTASAGASFHLMKVREVFPNGNHDDYIELQMTAAGQNFVAGHDVTVYNSIGVVTSTIPLSNVGNGANQATILIGDTDVVGADFTFMNLDVGPSGAACWAAGTPPDCVTWGDFIPQGGFPNPQTADFANPAGITPGMAIRRTIARGCPTALDDADDTDNSAADFAEVPPDPTPNGAIPVETACLLPPQLNPTPGPQTSGGSPSKKQKKCKKAKKKKRKKGKKRSASTAKGCKKKKKGKKK